MRSAKNFYSKARRSSELVLCRAADCKASGETTYRSRARFPYRLVLLGKLVSAMLQFRRGQRFRALPQPGLFLSARRETVRCASDRIARSKERRRHTWAAWCVVKREYGPRWRADGGRSRGMHE